VATRDATDARPARRDLGPWLIVAFTLGLWLIETHGGLWRTSVRSHYLYLADAFNHGQLHLVHQPARLLDLAQFGGRTYVVFGPLPALPLMPLVAWLGPATPDIAVLVLTALFAIFAFDRFLLHAHRRFSGQAPAPSPFVRICTTLSFALGTALHYGAPMGSVWLHAQISALALQCWGLWMAAAGRPAWSGVAFGLSVLTRSTVTLAAPFAVWLLADPAVEATARSWRRSFAPAVAVFGAVAIGACLHGLYNLARFGAPANAGYYYLRLDPEIRQGVEQYGRFNLHFLPHNLYGWLLRLPESAGGSLQPDPHGMSLLLSVPFLWLVFVPRRVSPIEWTALATAALVAVPSLLYHNDGWVQFGQRFALDWIALALLVASFGAARAPAWLVGALTVAGIAVNAWGLAWFQSTQLH
jgi:hypothetical protein